MTPYQELVSFILPKEIFEAFEVMKTEVKVEGDERVMYIHLDEFDHAPVIGIELFPNGFYDASKITDFPIRQRKVILLVRRRRWKDAEGNSYTHDWNLTAKGSCISNEFATFLKSRTLPSKDS